MPDDKRSEEIYNYFLSLAKDMQTIKGIPLVNIDNKEAYDAAVSKMSTLFGIKKSWFSDVLTINLSEFCNYYWSSCTFFKWDEEDKEEFADLSSSLLKRPQLAPTLLMIAALISLGSSFTRSKNRNNLRISKRFY